jgi:hypothetical protein
MSALQRFELLMLIRLADPNTPLLRCLELDRISKVSSKDEVIFNLEPEIEELGLVNRDSNFSDYNL